MCDDAGFAAACACKYEAVSVVHESGGLLLYGVQGFEDIAGIHFGKGNGFECYIGQSVVRKYIIL